MNREIITPESEDAWLALRVNDLTSTDIPALFGLSPYKTAFELWHEKRSAEIVRITDNDRMKWGRRLESTVAEGISEDQGWSVRPFKEYMRIPEHRVGSSFDFRIVQNCPSDVRMFASEFDSADDAILEIKTVDYLAFRDGWLIDDGFIEAPPHIEIQVQHQMLVSGLRRAFLGVMVGGNRIEVIERRADDAVHAGIITRAREFWQSIDENHPPEPVMPDDADAVIRMNQFAQPGKLFDARGDAGIATLLSEYNRVKREARDLEEIAKTHKADILVKIGDAEKVLADGFTISAGIVGPADVSYTREAYRNFRVTMKKAAQAKEAAE